MRRGRESPYSTTGRFNSTERGGRVRVSYLYHFDCSDIDSKKALGSLMSKTIIHVNIFVQSWNGGQVEPSVWSPRNDYITYLENWRKGSQEKVPDREDISEGRRGISDLDHSKLCKFFSFRVRLSLFLFGITFNKFVFRILTARPQSWRVDEPTALRDLQSSPFSHSSRGEDRPFSKGQTGVSKKLGFWDNYSLPEW